MSIAQSSISSDIDDSSLDIKVRLLNGVKLKAELENDEASSDDMLS